MGLSPDEVKKLNLKDFNRLLIAYNRRKDEQWDIARTIMADIRSCAFGAKKAVKSTQVMKIHSIDNDFTEKVKHIQNKQEAEKLLSTF